MEIYILRHGIAENLEAGKTDADRKLTKEGKEKLRAVLQRAKAAEARPTLILSSPLRRAVETAEIAAEVSGYKEKILQTRALMPDRMPEEVWEEIRVHKGTEEMLLAGHEPQLSQLVAYLLGVPSLMVDMKKGAMVHIAIDQFGAHPRGTLRWMITSKLAGAVS